MQPTLRFLVLILLLLAAHPLAAQLSDVKHYQTAPLPELEEELQPVAMEILRGPSYTRALALNQQLQERLEAMLARPESYNYPFDSLTTISRLYPADDAFRIFTWQLVLQDTFNTTREHTYHGFVQRKYTMQNGKDTILLYNLNDEVDYDPRVESMQLDQTNWMGALYYKPKMEDHGVMVYDGKYARVDGLTGKLDKRDVRYYILMGYNGHTIGANYKILDAITFDPQDSSKVLFGVPIFHFNSVAKYRVVFKYSDNSHFSLNQRLVVTGLFRRKRPMIVFDHLVAPRNANPHELFAMGPDGTQDALYWINRVLNNRKGFFVYMRNVTVYDPSIEHYDPKVLERQMKREEKRLRRMGIERRKQKRRQRREEQRAGRD